MATTTDNPFLSARMEWNERYGGLVRSAVAWRVVAITSLVLAIGTTTFALVQSTEVKLVPYIVQVDRLGTPVLAGFPEQIQYADPRVVRAMLGAFVSDFRSVTPDAVVQKQYIDRTYALLRTPDPATEKVNGWFRGSNPFERARTTTVSIEVHSVVALSEHTYQVDWSELERDRRGKELATKRYRGIATVSIAPPQDEAVINLNPIGLYVRDLEWTAQI